MLSFNIKIHFLKHPVSIYENLSCTKLPFFPFKVRKLDSIEFGEPQFVFIYSDLDLQSIQDTVHKLNTTI